MFFENLIETENTNNYNLPAITLNSYSLLIDLDNYLSDISENDSLL